MTFLQRLKDWPANDDPRAAACASIAMVVAWNQPFYPLYLRWLVGGNAWLGCITFFSTPFFVAVPFIARRSSYAGRMALVLTGLGNTVLSSWAFGEASGVGWFALPIALIAALAFGRSERRTAAVLVLLTFAIPATLHLVALPPLGHYDAGEYRRFDRMNLTSVVMLTLVIGWTFRGIFRDQASARATQ